jgi:peptidoglycan/LPS O-acetylase OafA/YrhL
MNTSGLRGRNPAYDGLRALAVLAVLGFHEGLAGLPGGFLGVEVFFVLSGYLITRTLANGQPLRMFWMRRVRRLAPALVVVLLVVTAAVTLAEPDQLGSLRAALLPALFYVSNWYEIARHGSYFARYGPPSPLLHLWSLAIEEQFYLVWPLVVLAIRPLRHRALVPATLAIASAVTMAVLYRHGGDPSRVYYGTDTDAFGLLIGATLAYVKPQPRAALDTAGVAGLAVLAWACGHLSGDDRLVYPCGLVVVALATTAVIAAATGEGVISRLLGAAPPRWLGERSYGVYLWHWPVIVLLGHGPLVDSAVAIGLAAASWRFIERPIIRDGFGATLRRQHQAGRATARTPVALSGVLAIAVIAVAGYGLTRPLGSGLTGQLAVGQRAIATSQDQHFTERRAHVVKGRQQCSGGEVTAIGDSVMVASASALVRRLRGVYIDAMVGRSMAAGIGVEQWLADRHELRRVVVAGLGTNGPVSPGQVATLVRIAGRSRGVVLVNAFVPRPWQDEVNQVFAAAARRDGRVVVADWYDAIAGRTWLLWDDGVHPRPDGAPLYAGVVARAVDRACAASQQLFSYRVDRHSTRAGSLVGISGKANLTFRNSRITRTSRKPPEGPASRVKHAHHEGRHHL